MSKAKGNYIGWTHADLQTDPKDVLSGFKLIETNKEFIKGSRVGRSVSDNIFSIGMAIFEQLSLKLSVKPCSTNDIFERIFFFHGKIFKDFSLDLYAYVMAKK